MKFLTALFVLANGAFVGANKPLRGKATAVESTVNTMVCHLRVGVVMTSELDARDTTDSRRYECSPVVDEVISDYTYNIDLPDDFVEENKASLYAGTLFADIPGGVLQESTVTYPANSRITVRDAPLKAYRDLAVRKKANGTKTLLVVRVSTVDGSNYWNAQQLDGFLFNQTDPDKKPSLSSQMNRISFGKLNLVKSKYGIIDCPLNMRIFGTPAVNIKNAVTAQLTAQYGVPSIFNLANYVLYCIPGGQGTWDGANVIGAGPMVLTSSACGYISNTMWIFGTTLGLPDGYNNGQRLVDFTTYMSAVYTSNYYPLKSFNGANFAQLGWYSDRMKTIDPNLGGQKLAVDTFVHYAKFIKTNPVLIKVGNSHYLQYNKAIDFNYQTQLLINQVAIVQQLPDRTNLLGGVDDKKQFKISNFEGSGRDLWVCGCAVVPGSGRKPDSLIISIGYSACYCS